jgi:o-succinylbenzoate synthase
VRIDRLDLRLCRLPLVAFFETSFGRVYDRAFLLVRLTGEGQEGWGEGVAEANPFYSSETTETSWHIITEFIAPRVIGRRFEHPRDIFDVLAPIRGHNMAKAAVEMAAWDLAARTEGVSLARKLGGTRGRIEVGISLGIQKSPEALVDKARKALERGYRKVKIKIKPGQDVEYVRAVREALGPDAPLMADANNAYTLDDVRGLQELDDLGLLMIEQPLAWDDVLRHADLQRRLKTPVCLDESITSVDRAQDMIDLGSGRIVNIKPGRVGGFRASKAIHDLCAAHGIPVWCGGMLESGVGRAYNVALASLPNFLKPGDISPSARYWERDLVSPEWTMENGLMAVPTGPGIGVTVEEERIEELTAGKWVSG